MSIIGVGIDVAEVERFAASLERTPGLVQRVFVEGELLLPSGERRAVAARAEELGVRSWHVSLSHDAGVASAAVIAEG
jgi:holo-[acyl-carrier protein] synthase